MRDGANNTFSDFDVITRAQTVSGLCYPTLGDFDMTDSLKCFKTKDVCAKPQNVSCQSVFGRML